MKEIAVTEEPGQAVAHGDPSGYIMYEKEARTVAKITVSDEGGPQETTTSAITAIFPDIGGVNVVNIRGIMVKHHPITGATTTIPNGGPNGGTITMVHKGYLTPEG